MEPLRPWSQAPTTPMKTTDMTKAELIKALDSVPEHTPLYVVDESNGTASFFDIAIIHYPTGEIAEIHLNH